MKKFISLLLITVMALSSFTAFAGDEDAMQKVLISVKERIGMTDTFKNFESNIRANKTSTIYSFYWDGHENGETLNVSATQSGLITGYYYHDGKSTYSDKPELNGITVEEAINRTKVLLDRLNPALKDSIRLVTEGITQDLYMNGFSFRIERYENGIRVLNNDGYVTVNRDATKIINFNLSYDENLVFPAPDKVMTKEEAQKLYGEKIGMMLEYKASYDYESKTRTIIPVYIPKETNKYINAITGEIEEYKYDDISYRNDLSFNTAMKEEAGDAAGFSEAEKAEFENIEGLKSKDELIKIVKSNSYTKVSDDMTLTWYNTSKSYYDNKYLATLSYEKTNGEYKYTNITLDMATGEILSFYKDEERNVNKKVTLSEDTIKAKKNKAVSDLAGKKAQEYRYDEKSGSYIRYINEIPFRQDNINVGISEITGEVRSYNISYTTYNFPALDGIITASDATDGLFNQISYNLCYSRMSSDNNAKLIYILQENIPTTIDAFSGKLLNHSNEEYVSDVFTGYTDIEGHYAQNAVNTLAKFGIRFEGTELKPDEAIKQKDFIALLISTFKSRSPIVLKAYENYKNEYSMALRQNILMPEEENPTETVTRESAAKFMIRALGYEEIANISGIYVCPFYDVSDFKGHISILSGLKIINGNGKGRFNPKNALSRADAVIMIYNYLSR